MRIVIELSEERVAALDVTADRLRLSRAEVIQQAVGEFIARRQNRDLESSFGLWGIREVDGLTYQERVRDEW